MPWENGAYLNDKVSNSRASGLFSPKDVGDGGLISASFVDVSAFSGNKISKGSLISKLSIEMYHLPRFAMCGSSHSHL